MLHLGQPGDLAQEGLLVRIERACGQLGPEAAKTLFPKRTSVEGRLGRHPVVGLDETDLLEVVARVGDRGVNVTLAGVAPCRAPLDAKRDAEVMHPEHVGIVGLVECRSQYASAPVGVSHGVESSE